MEPTRGYYSVLPSGLKVGDYVRPWYGQREHGKAHRWTDRWVKITEVKPRTRGGDISIHGVTADGRTYAGSLNHHSTIPAYIS